MALGANCKLIPESLVYSETLEDYIITAEYNLPANKREAQTPALGDSFPDNEAPWGYIVVSTDWGTPMRRPDQGAQTVTVKFSKPKIPFTSGITGLYEVHRNLATGYRGRVMGTRVFLAADAAAEGLAEAHLPEGTGMAASGTWAAAPLREKAIERRWRVGLARITAIYDSEGDWGLLEQTGKGILEADAAAVEMWNNAAGLGEDKEGTEIRVGMSFFTEAEPNLEKCWVVVRGNNAWPLVRAQLRIRVLLTESQLAALAPLVGTINSNACPHVLSGAAERTLWFNKLGLRQRNRAAGTRYDTTVYLKYDPDKWDAATEVELQEFDVVRTPVKEDGAAVEGVSHPIGAWVPVGGVDHKQILPSREAAYGIIDSYLA
jgi:hypothetical protein